MFAGTINKNKSHLPIFNKTTHQYNNQETPVFTSPKRSIFNRDNYPYSHIIRNGHSKKN
jgi:hypothetical protein